MNYDSQEHYEAAMNDQAYYEAEMANAAAQGEYESQMAEMEPEWDELEKQSLSALNQFQKGLTKIDIKEMAGNVIENLLINGNPMQIAECLSAMELFIKEVKEDPRYRDYVREEAGKYPKGFVSKSGARIECAEVGTSYDYSMCNDIELQSLEFQLTDLDIKIKTRRNFLKGVPSTGLIITDSETGETATVYPPAKSSTSSIKVTLAKGF